MERERQSEYDNRETFDEFESMDSSLAMMYYFVKWLCHLGINSMILVKKIVLSTAYWELQFLHTGSWEPHSSLYWLDGVSLFGSTIRNQDLVDLMTKIGIEESKTSLL